jgi:hypothetical protein
MNKYKYLVESALNFFSERSCPSCGYSGVKSIDQKYIVTRLFKCSNCNLLFRHPKDNALKNFKFYQKDYGQNDNITTSRPSAEELEKMKSDNFGNKDVGFYLKVFASLLKTTDFSKIKMIDYGCSWGYMTYQFKNSGINCQGYEISKPRAAFGNENLGLSILTNEEDIPGLNDIFFSSHVIEHVPSPHNMITLGKKLLKNGGYFIAESPNGSQAFRDKYPDEFHKLWGQVHPNFLTDEFYANAFKPYPYLIASSPFNGKLNEIERWDGRSQVILDTSGSELLVIAKIDSGVDG